MKIYFRNKAAKLKRCTEGAYSCERCPFFKPPICCPRNTSTILNCYGKGYWVDGEFIDIFKI
jgi:hypothetical protein